MIFCVVPRELEADLFDRLAAHYSGNPNVSVIVDRRRGADRRLARAAGGADERRLVRERRRARIPGTFPSTDAPS